MLATQGINEEQTVANLLRTHTAEQARLNAAALATLVGYQAKCAALPPAHAGGRGRPEDSHVLEAEARQRSMLSQRQRRMLEDARRVLESPPEAKNVAFLQVRTLPLGPTLAYLTLILTLTLTLTLTLSLSLSLTLALTLPAACSAPHARDERWAHHYV